MSIDQMFIPSARSGLINLQADQVVISQTFEAHDYTPHTWYLDSPGSPECRGLDTPSSEPRSELYIEKVVLLLSSPYIYLENPKAAKAKVYHISINVLPFYQIYIDNQN